MPTLTIGDKSVTVDDGFLKLSPEQQNAAVADIAKSLGVTGAPEAAADPVTTNQVVRATATGVPIVGGLLNQANAATNAALAPVLNPLFDEKDQLKGKTFSERRAESLRQQNEMDKRFEEQHPVIDTVAKVAGGVGGSIPAMMAAPAAFGLTGTLPQMVARGAASNAALGGVDAITRSQDPLAPAAVGGILGGTLPLVGRGVGKLAQGVREWRNPSPVVPQNLETVAGVDIPLTTGQKASDPIAQAEEEIMRRGGRGGSAEAIARQADEEARAAVEQASGNIAASLDPAAASARTAPQAAAEVVQSELAAAAAARAAAEQQQALRVVSEGESLARGLGGGAAPVSPFDAAENTGAAVTRARDAKVAATREAYKARDAVEGTFDPSVPRGMAEDIRTRLNAGENPIWVDPTNESTANKALKLIDETLGKDTGLFKNAAAPMPPPERAAAPVAAAVEDPTVTALRQKYGNEVAEAYLKQGGAKPEAKAVPSLLQFIAAKGGLRPDAELEALGLATGHRAQIPGQSGFFNVVGKNGSPLDRMREAAEEAGYLRGADGGTSTPREFLDLIEAELRGQKRYPAGHEGHVTKKEGAARGAREQAEYDRVNQGLENDLSEAGHGGLKSDVKERAVKLMREDGMSADEAVDTAFMQLDQEEAAGAVASGLPKGAPAASGFPGDKPLAAAAPRDVDLRAMDEARKRLVTMFGDAKSKAISTGDKSDMRAMGKILEEFDNSISDALASGKFSGDAKLAADLQAAARKSHAEYRQTFSSRGPGDEIGRQVEKILGRYHDTAATPGEIANMAYGPASNPGSGNTEKIALRLRDILGENSADWQRYKQGLFVHIAQAGAGDAPLAPAKAAGRIDKFLNGQTSRFANKIFSPEERRQMANYAKSLRAAEPSTAPLNEVEKAVARIAGTDGHLPASPVEVADMLYGRAGKGDKGLSVRLALRIKNDLTPESWTAVRQGMWEKLTARGEGLEPFGPQALSTRLHDFLNGNGKPLARVMFSKAEREEMAKLASIYKRMTPLKGTTNPSGTAPMLAKIASRASDNVLALIGLGAGGVPGAIAGHALQRGAGAIKEARAAKEATRLFFGPQARRPAGHSRLPQLIGASAIPASQR
jgi:hypothetical protein